jgi:hypothetical protein
MHPRFPDESKRGPRKNPYDVRLSRWTPVTGADKEIWLPSALASAPVKKGRPDALFTEVTPQDVSAAYACYKLLERSLVPVTLRFLQANLMHVGGFDPALVRKVANQLRDYVPDVVVNRALQTGENETSHIYVLGREPHDAELAALLDLIRKNRSVLSIGVLRSAGERYVRACFVRSKRYSNITKPDALGYEVTGPRDNQVDVMVSDTANGQRYAVSVKNQREFLEARSKWIGECIKMAKAHGARPWIITSFATDAGTESCTKQGVRCTVIGARIAPETYDERSKPMKKLLPKFYPILGGEPYVCIGEQRIHGNPPLASALREVDVPY